MDSSDEDLMDGANRQNIFNEDFLRQLMQQKVAEPGMFVSNWEDEDDSGIIPENPDSDKTKILKAAEDGDCARVNELLSIDLSLVLASDDDQYTPLHRASYNDHANVVELLLQKGANISARTECGWQPIHCAAKWGNAHALHTLVVLGNADVNALTNGKLTPLHLAATCKDPGGVECVRLLLSHPNIALDLLSDGGETPKDVARQTSEAMMKLFDPKTTTTTTTTTTNNVDEENRMET